MNLEVLQEMWKKDSVIDTDLYCEESTKIPQLHMKYMEFFNMYSLMKREREFELNKLVKDKWLYYKGKAPSTIYKEMPFDLKLTTKEVITMFIDADDDIKKLQFKIAYIEQTLTFLDSVLRQINNRTYQIKNAIEWVKFKSGF
ncbi:UvsY-like recombination mediator [Synechococcus phage S-MbCM6]|uniref:UvsY n=1 Tax=Synechococcus phage S-MbCM6 TaxID=3126011 RepID=H8ZML8_9CAUD|nr:UvsY-like recombination mediator [Synechococcus phage ACG-2014c]AFD02729.1 UvsY [Synechococcus phage ACG-2014c]